MIYLCYTTRLTSVTLLTLHDIVAAKRFSQTIENGDCFIFRRLLISLSSFGTIEE